MYNILINYTINKTFVKAAFIAVLALAAGTNAHRAYCNQFSLSDFALANIEALANSTESNIGEKCYRAKSTGNCYDSNNKYVGIYVKEVEEYIRTNDLQICHQQKVTSFPPGTTAK